MANYFYTDSDGNKQGPLNGQQLQALAAKEIIEPTTPLMTDTGHTGLAGQIPGLQFNTAASSPFAQAAHTVPHRPTLAMQAGMLAKNAGVGGILVWLLDFAFRDLRLPIINHWACRIVYAICCLVAILCGIVMTLIGIASLFQASPLATLLVVPLIWLGVVLFICASRLLCEWYIIVFDWIVETTKAARHYSENNKS
jgi:hypothetical protein